MSRTFTLHEAQTLLPVLEALLKRAQASARRELELEMEMQELNQAIFLAGGMHVNVIQAARRRGERDKCEQQTKDTLSEIDAVGVQVQDLADGVLDFPCQMEGGTVMLCWKLGEPTITHWHAADESYETRRPIDTRFGKMDRERPN